MIKTLITTLAIAALVSCSDRSATTNSAVPLDVDSLTAHFLAGWNNKDSAAISSSISENAILLTDSVVHRGLAEIGENWISGGVKVVSNLKTSSLIKDSDINIAYAAGTYTHDLTTPGGEVFKINGNYSFAWTRQANGECKLKFIHIEALTTR